MRIHAVDSPFNSLTTRRIIPWMPPDDSKPDRRALALAGSMISVLLALWSVERLTDIPAAGTPYGIWADINQIEIRVVVLAAGLSIVQIARIVNGKTRGRKLDLSLRAVALAIAVLAWMPLLAAWQTERLDLSALARVSLLSAAWLGIWTAAAARIRGSSLTTASILGGIPLAGLLAWIAVHPAENPAGRGNPVDILAIGMLMLTMLVATFVAIFWGALLHAGVARFWLGVAKLAAYGAFWLALLAWESGSLELLHTLKLSLLLATWIAACAGVTQLLRRFGPGVAVTVPAALAAILLAFPAAVVPLHRALQHPGSTAADRTVAWIAPACPVLGTLDAISDRVPFAWPEGTGNRVMYRLTTLGQDAPWPRTTWWSETLLYAALAALAGALGWASGVKRSG